MSKCDWLLSMFCFVKNMLEQIEVLSTFSICSHGLSQFELQDLHWLVSELALV